MRMILAAFIAVPFFALPAFAAEPATGAATTTAAMPAPVAPVAAPEGSTALCKDGTYTSQHNYSGACSSHKGVAKWLNVH